MITVVTNYLEYYNRAINETKPLNPELVRFSTFLDFFYAEGGGGVCIDSTTYERMLRI
jgi:hypothetical protein